MWKNNHHHKIELIEPTWQESQNIKITEDWKLKHAKSSNRGFLCWGRGCGYEGRPTSNEVEESYHFPWTVDFVVEERTNIKPKKPYKEALSGCL